MSNVAAMQPAGSLSIILEVLLKHPQNVGKLLELIKEFTKGVDGLLCGYDRSWIMHNFDKFDLGIKPIRDVQKGPIKASSSCGRKEEE